MPGTFLTSPGLVSSPYPRLVQAGLDRRPSISSFRARPASRLSSRLLLTSALLPCSVRLVSSVSTNHVLPSRTTSPATTYSPTVHSLPGIHTADPSNMTSSGLPSSMCGNANDSSYASADQASIRSSGQSSIKSGSTGKPKRTVRFQDPDPVDSLAPSIDLQPSPNLSLSSLDLSDDSSSYSRHSRQSSSVASSIRSGKRPVRSSSPAFARPLGSLRPPLTRGNSASSTASAPGELEFTDWLSRMEEIRASKESKSEQQVSKSGRKDNDKDERKKKRRSWVNLLVR